MSGGGGSSSDGGNDMQVSGMEAAISQEKGISTHAESRVGPSQASRDRDDYSSMDQEEQAVYDAPKAPDTSTVGIAANRDDYFNLDQEGQAEVDRARAISQGTITIDPMTGEERSGRYITNPNTGQLERRDLSFQEHWDNAPKAIKWSPTLRFLYSTGKNINEWAKSKGWTFNGSTGNFTDNTGDNVGERDLMNAAAPDAPELISKQNNTQTTTGYSASQWYTNLGNTNTTGSNPFSFSTAFADAKAKQQTILGNPSAIKQLAVNESPFYGFLKKNSLDKGIL